MQSYHLFARLIEILGAPRLASALGLRRTDSVYRLARHPMDGDDPDGTGTRNDFDRLEAVVEAAAMRSGGRAVIREMDLWWRALMARALDGLHPEPLTDCRLARRVGATVREFADVLTACDPETLDPAKLAREGAEAIEAIATLVLAAQAGTNAPEG